MTLEEGTSVVDRILPLLIRGIFGMTADVNASLLGTRAQELHHLNHGHAMSL